MDKLFYLTVLDTEDKEKVGILGKIKGQILAMNKRGIDVHFGHFQGKNTFVIENSTITAIPSHGIISRDLLASVYPQISEYIVNQKIGVLYVRLTALDMRAMNFYKKLKQNGICIIIEFYSHNLELETRKTIKRSFKSKKYGFAAKKTISYIINWYYLRQLYKYVDRIVTTTDVNGNLYGIPTINVKNGITPDTMPPIKKINNGNDLTIVSVAMISVWHGYDRLIKGIKNYYENGGKKKIIYYVIGDGEGKRELEMLVNSYKLNNIVVFPGIKTGEQLNEFYNQADLALEMLAGFRRTNGPISSIKMAEYFAKGIPVVYSTNEDIYDNRVLQYCLKVPYDDTDINIEDLFSFLKELNNRNESIAEQMHKIAVDEFDWVNTAKELHDYILSI